MIKIKFIVLLMLVIFSISIKGEDKTRKLKVNGSSSVVVDAEYAEVSIRIHVYGVEFEANTKKIMKVISDIEKSLSVYEIKEGSYAKPLIEHGFEKSNSKFSGSKTSGPSSNSGDIGFSSCTLVLTVLKLESLGYIYKEIAKIEDASVVGTQLKINEEEGIKLMQYKKALLLARTKGELMASTLNAKLGAPLLIEEVIEPKNTQNDVVNQIKFDRGNNKNNFGKITVHVNVMIEFQID